MNLIKKSLIGTLFSSTFFSYQTYGYESSAIFHSNESKNFVESLAVDQTDSTDNSYMIYSLKQTQRVYKITEQNWKQKTKNKDLRWNLLYQAYSANSVDTENSNDTKTSVFCFVGEADQIIKKFFPKETVITNVSKIKLSASADQTLIGVDVTLNKSKGFKKLYFRFPHCLEGGKLPLIKNNDINNASIFKDDSSQRSVAQIINDRIKVQDDVKENGFDNYDKLNKADTPIMSEKKLPLFKLKSDYDKIKISQLSRPWIGMSIKTPSEAKKVAELVLDHFYDSMITDLKNPDYNFIALNSPSNKAQWCQMPWLNIGNARREIIHGLTRDRDIQPSTLFPHAGTTPEFQGTDWGKGFYNEIGCDLIGKTFGTKESPISKPNFTNIDFKDGTATVKILFTTAALPELETSFPWTANVSLPDSNSRRLRPVKLLQIDVAIKDSTVNGVYKEANNWFMITYYFDKTYSYNSKHTAALKGTPLESLLKMRPVGVQSGFTRAESIIFEGSKTNNPDQQLNGPADNPKTTCLACHAVAGSNKKMVPGILSFDDFQKIKSVSLDFSQQLALAKKNFETRSGQ